MGIFDHVRTGKITYASQGEYQRATGAAIERAKRGQAYADDLAQIKHAVANQYSNAPDRDTFGDYRQMIGQAQAVVDLAESGICPMCGTSECRHNS